MLTHRSIPTGHAGHSSLLRAVSQPVGRLRHRKRLQPAAAFLSQVADSISDPILRMALKEPIAFWGGFTAGALALNLKEDPLRSWIERTAADAQAESTRREVGGTPAAIARSRMQEQMRGSYGVTPSNGSRRS